MALKILWYHKQPNEKYLLEIAQCDDSLTSQFSREMCLYVYKGSQITYKSASLYDFPKTC